MEKLQLNKAFARNTPVDDRDVMIVKRALNRLGYYMPLPSIGISNTPDRDVFTALQAFQHDQGIETTGTMRPDDPTLDRLNIVNRENKIIRYRWKTVGDGRVRSSHAALHNTVREAGDYLDPGEDPGCRCWMEIIKVEEFDCEQLSIELQNRLLQLQSDQEAVNRADRRAKELDRQLAAINKQIPEQFRDSMLDIGMSLTPGPRMRIPILGTVLEVGEEGARIYRLFIEKSRIWQALADARAEQNFFANQAEKRQQEIKDVQDRMRDAGCDVF